LKIPPIFNVPEISKKFLRTFLITSVIDEKKDVVYIKILVVNLFKLSLIIVLKKRFFIVY